MANYLTDNNKALNVRRINKLLEELKREQSSESVQLLVESLQRIKNGKEEPKIKPLSLYLDILEKISAQTALASGIATQAKNAEALYDALFLFGEETPEFEETAEIFKLLAGENGLVMKGFYDPFLFASFGDKRNYLTLVQVIAEQKSALKLFQEVSKSALEAREYLADDMAYLTYLLKLASKLAKVGPNGHDAILEEELIRLRRCNGVYDIDPVRLAQVEKDVTTAATTVEGGRNTLQAIEHKSREMERILKEMDEKSKDALLNMEVFLEEKIGNAKGTIDSVLKEYEESQKKSIYLEKEIFLKQLFSDAESELGRYRAMAGEITATAAADVEHLSRETDAVIKRLQSAADDHERLEKFSKRSKQDAELLKKIEKLTILNDSMMERLQAAGRGLPPAGPDGVEFGPGGRGVGPDGVEFGPEGRGVGSDGIGFGPEGRGFGLEGKGGKNFGFAGTGGRPPYKPGRRRGGPIPAVNPLLDRQVPFKDRFAIVMKEKKRRMATGELFHEMFDDVITAIMEEVNPYLIGPSGCGKTYMVRQISEILNVELSDIGYINEEYDILGYVTAMGDYSESNFYWLYKYGGIAFCDELDNGNSKATVKLNSFLSNQQHASYCFPGGERVDKHPNFRMIAAGNTDGSGADVNYNTRERIEESVLQRMIPIYVGYDNRVEKEILKKYPHWFEFACAFREATDRWEEASGIPAQGIFTTRDAYRIQNYLDNGSFTPQKIMNYEFVQTKEPEYLGFLKDEIGKKLEKSTNAYQIYQLFADEVDQVRRKGRKG